MRLWQAPCSNLCFKILCTQKQCFLLDLFFSIIFLLRSIAINSCSFMKTTWANFDWFGAMTFLLKNQNPKSGKKMKTCCKYGFTYVVYRMWNHKPSAAAIPMPHCRYGFVTSLFLFFWSLHLSRELVVLLPPCIHPRVGYYPAAGSTHYKDNNT